MPPNLPPPNLGGGSTPPHIHTSPAPRAQQRLELTEASHSSGCRRRCQDRGEDVGHRHTHHRAVPYTRKLEGGNSPLPTPPQSLGVPPNPTLALAGVPGHRGARSQGRSRSPTPWGGARSVPALFIPVFSSAFCPSPPPQQGKKPGCKKWGATTAGEHPNLSQQGK